jgi:putative peptidoglycan lipid II flippase
MKGLPWRSAAFVMLGALIGRVLGIGREAVFAHHFGAGFLTDAYLVAVLIPLLLQNVVAGGSLQAAFVPMVADEAALRGRPAANQMVADLALLTTLGLAVVALIVAILAEPIVRITASGFSAEAVNAAAEMLRWCALLVVLNGFLAVALGALNTFGEFATTASLSPVLNGVQIVAIVALAPLLGIRAALVGLLAGTAAQCLLQLVPLHRYGVRLLRPRWSVVLWRRLLPGFVPAALASLVAQGNPLADKVIGSYLVAGSITYLNYSELFAGGVAIVTTSVALVTFPTMSTALAEGDRDRALAVLRQAAHVNLLTAVPLALLLGTFAPDLVHAVYGWGRLAPADLHQVARCLLAYSFGIPVTGLFYLLVRACYAIKRPGFAILLTGTFFLVHAAIGLALAPRLGAAGLAIGTSSGALITGLGGWFVLRSDLLRRAGADTLRWFVRLGVIGAVAVAVPAALLRPWSHVGPAADSLWRLPLAFTIGALVLVPLVRRADPESHRLFLRAWERLSAPLRAGSVDPSPPN